MEDFIPILLAILWLVIGFFNQDKKRKKAQQQKQQQPLEPSPSMAPAPEPETEPIDLEVLMEEFFGKKEKPVPAEPPVQESPYREYSSEKQYKETQERRDAQAERFEPARETSYSEYSSQHQYENSFDRDEPVYDILGQDTPSVYEQYAGVLGSEDQGTMLSGVSSIDEIIKSYEQQDMKLEEEQESLSVESIEERAAQDSGFQFDGRQAIIYSEIINKRVF